MDSSELGHLDPRLVGGAGVHSAQRPELARLMPPITTIWHLADLIVQWKAPRWFRLLFAVSGLIGNRVLALPSTEVSRERANRAVDDWLTSSRPITRN